MKPCEMNLATWNRITSFQSDMLTSRYGFKFLSIFYPIFEQMWLTMQKTRDDLILYAHHYDMQTNSETYESWRKKNIGVKNEQQSTVGH